MLSVCYHNEMDGWQVYDDVTCKHVFTGNKASKGLVEAWMRENRDVVFGEAPENHEVLLHAELVNRALDILQNALADLKGVEFPHLLFDSIPEADYARGEVQEIIDVLAQKFGNYLVENRLLDK